MALCVTITPEGTLVPTGQAVAECVGYVMVTPGEYAWLDLMQQALAAPSVEEATALVIGGFGSILVFYVVARICGAVGNFFG